MQEIVLRPSSPFISLQTWDTRAWNCIHQSTLFDYIFLLMVCDQSGLEEWCQCITAMGTSTSKLSVEWIITSRHKGEHLAEERSKLN